MLHRALFVFRDWFWCLWWSYMPSTSDLLPNMSIGHFVSYLLLDIWAWNWFQELVTCLIQAIFSSSWAIANPIDHACGLRFFGVVYTTKGTLWIAKLETYSDRCLGRRLRNHKLNASAISLLCMTVPLGNRRRHVQQLGACALMSKNVVNSPWGSPLIIMLCEEKIYVVSRLLLYAQCSVKLQIYACLLFFLENVFATVIRLL